MRFKPLTLAVMALSACAGGEKGGTDSGAAGANAGGSSAVDLTGAGATFPYPIYSKWFADYTAETGVKINYQSLGSGAGIRQLQEGTVDFGASDGPMSDEEISKAKGGGVLHFPSILGAVAITYNLPSVTQQLKFDGATVADIFLGKITKWNDGRIAALNPGVKLPPDNILVVHRSDGSGTTYVFTDFLSTVSPAWKSGPGKGKDVQWPVGLGAKGNEAVAGQVKQTPATIAYAELAYVEQNRMAAAAIKNSAGNFVAPTIASTTAAAAAAAANLSPTTDYRISIVNPAGADAYPIASFTWLLVYQKQPDAVKGKKLVDFLRWAYKAGQSRAAPLHYAPLPALMIPQLEQRVDSIKVGAGQ